MTNKRALGIDRGTSVVHTTQHEIHTHISHRHSRKPQPEAWRRRSGPDAVPIACTSSDRIIDARIPLDTIANDNRSTAISPPHRRNNHVGDIRQYSATSFFFDEPARFHGRRRRRNAAAAPPAQEPLLPPTTRTIDRQRPGDHLVGAEPGGQHEARIDAVGNPTGEGFGSLVGRYDRGGFGRRRCQQR